MELVTACWIVRHGVTGPHVGLSVPVVETWSVAAPADAVRVNRPKATTPMTTIFRERVCITR
jgi:hypothetical protein